MQYLSLEPFVPSGAEFNKSKELFIALGFPVRWDMEDYVGFGDDGFRFILQRYHHDEFAQNFMLSVRVDDIDAFQEMVLNKKLVEKFGIRVGTIIQQPYGRELNIIDIAGVCWHFVQ